MSDDDEDDDGQTEGRRTINLTVIYTNGLQVMIFLLYGGVKAINIQQKPYFKF